MVDRHGLSRREAEHNRHSVDTLDSEESGPTAGGERSYGRRGGEQPFKHSRHWQTCGAAQGPAQQA